MPSDEFSSEEVSEDSIQEVIPLLIEVQNNLDQDFSLQTLARQQGYSPFHFHRVFSSVVGETPKQHVDRLRLERAAYKLAIGQGSVLEIALAVGFKNHETFSRAFKRAFNHTPRDYRRACRAAQADRLERNRSFRGEGCLLSEVRFVTLPKMTFLAIRRHGGYRECPLPFLEEDTLWKDLLACATKNKVSPSPIALAIFYDDPTVTPSALQRLDACIPIRGEGFSEGRVRRLDFPGGRYGGIEFAGPISTIDQAYRTLADGIRRSPHFDFDEGPPVQIYRQIHVDGDPSANRMEIYFPVRKSR